jgi:hypothetical protein
VRAAIVDGRVVEHPTRELTDRAARRVTKALRRQGIRVEPVTDIFGVVHLWATVPTTTRQEVKALYAFREVTDCRLAWHEAEAS